MDSHHHDIIRLAWSRHFDLGDSAFRPGVRHVHSDENATSVTFVRLGDSSALIGPASALTAAATMSDDELTGGRLRELASGRTSGPIVLSYADDAGTTIDRHDPLISHERAHVDSLESACAPDDVIAADLVHKQSWFTLLGDDAPVDAAAPLASAGYAEWQGLLGDLGVLTAPDARRQGNGQVVSRLATNEAFDEGMIPQWRCHADNVVARRLGARLGFEEWGALVSIEVG
ncbi:GNAT family N-acetyltransferase [Rhodococcoides fascians]|uniref:GNAT family N-acetyltransferase n=1 Tax=Rhodococcoides fascians TaxID=1828 RepID=UPI00055B2701|nr:N-acetyltransferase [Rhodococcus fascians]